MGSNLNESLDEKSFAAFYGHHLNTYLADPSDFQGNYLIQKEFRQLVDRFASCVPDAQCQTWGWKNPRSMLLLPLIHCVLPEMRFIHLVRDGRYMAYSNNQAQLLKHGRIMLENFDPPVYSPVCAIDFWQKANLGVARFGQSVIGRRYCWMRYEDLVCGDPLVLSPLAKFLDVNQTDLEMIIARLSNPPKQEVWRCQSPEELAFVSRVGYAGLSYFGYV